MALGLSTELGLNEVYKDMIKQRELLREGSDSNLIHKEIEEILSDFKSKISVEGIEEKLRDVEKYSPLTTAEKSIIKSIQKVLDALEALEKVQYDGIITMVAGGGKSDTKDEMSDKDAEFAENLDKETPPPSEEPPANDEGFKF